MGHKVYKLLHIFMDFNLNIDWKILTTVVVFIRNKAQKSEWMSDDCPLFE